MSKIFNISGACRPDKHYMVQLGSRLAEIRKMIDAGDYFAINRARQYGKTTTLRALADFLKEDYVVVNLDFQNIESVEFMSGSSFVHALTREISKKIKNRADVPEEIKKKLVNLADSASENVRMAEMFQCFSEWCRLSEKQIVLLIDEVDTAANNQIFLDFLAQLRAAYLDRDDTPAFQSVILAGVYDIRNIRQKIRPDEAHKVNSPWNTRESNEPSESLLSFGDCPRNQMMYTPFDIAADFKVDMNFSVKDICGVLEEYEADYHTGMDISEMAGLLYDYTSGYPYLVSRLCKFLDERETEGNDFPGGDSAWTKEGILEAVKCVLTERSTLFESLTGKLADYPELRGMICRLLFEGQTIAYNVDDPAVDMLLMFGFIKAERGTVQIANRIFEMRLYNYYLTLPEVQSGDMYKLALRSKEQFIKNGMLDMKRVLEKFVEHFDDIYGDRGEKFVEEDGRRYFMLYLKPIINGTGNCYVETQTRNQERTDLIIDFLGRQYIVELKIWHGNAYNERGEEQLSAYLDHFHLKKGYMLSFNFNKRKEIGVKEIMLGDKVLIEATV